MKKTLLPLALISLTLVGCENPLKLTQKMADTTSRMETKTSAMSTYVENTNENSAKLGMLMAQGQSSDFRDTQFARMLEAKDFMEKMDYAVKFMYSMEFQVFSDEGIAEFDTEAMLNEARSEAIKEIPKKLNAIFNKKLKKGIKGTESDKDSENFFAVACALHYMNPKQAQFRKQLGIPTESLLDLITSSLAKKEDLESGKIRENELAKYEREVLKEERLFVRLIEARHRFIPAMAVARISRLQDGLLHKADMLLTKWRPTFLNPKFAGEMNSVQINYISEMLSHSVAAKNYLAEQGRSSKLDKKLKKIIKHIDLSQDPKNPVQLNEVSQGAIESMAISFKNLIELDEQGGDDASEQSAE